jgi:hypothetical protein
MMSDLPELPVRHETRESAIGEVLWEDVYGPYTADQMRAYASEAVLVERERCARLVEAETIWNDWDQQQLATTIRKDPA